jgi:hypothetical protein
LKCRSVNWQAEVARSGPWAMPLIHEPARPADAFAAIVFERDRLLALLDRLLVQHVERFQHRHVCIQVLGFVTNHPPAHSRAFLPPDMQDQFHYL